MGRAGRAGSVRLDEKCGSLPGAYAGPAADDHVCGAVDERLHVLARPRLERSRALFDTHDEAAHLAAALLEGKPRIALAPRDRGRFLDVAAPDAQGRDPTGVAIQPAQGDQGVDQPQSKGSVERLQRGGRCPDG